MDSTAIIMTGNSAAHISGIQSFEALKRNFLHCGRSFSYTIRLHKKP